MPKHGHIRKGSLQFYPRKRAKKILPRVNWYSINNSRKDAGLLGFIGYKVGMASAYVKDNTQHSFTKGKRIIIPISIIECPPIKILSVRVYKNGKIVREVLNDNIEKELKRKIKLPKQKTKKIEDFFKEIENDDVRIVVYSIVKKTGIKKAPDISEIGLSGSINDKISFIKEHYNKEIVLKDFINDEFLKQGLVDIRGVTKGKGFQGSTKRFGLNLQQHKTEKGVRGPGSGGPWHPARVEFRQPMAGQMGFFTRTTCNNKIVSLGRISENNINISSGFKHYGIIKNDYLIIAGSIQGPAKRPLIITSPLRSTKKQIKKNYEFLELR
ncbi:50S ribosomal protein L3 [Candidatus Pacearchaeota archaeon]|nr:50S ribosomal protein L3 [Candidatus Pacearchaeota archaeon]